ncbi:MAG: hypothetical protein M1830_009390 [Pleopsidium flavum]|nr:MAG: hypothetical protein M1830_009390 [Pleopsidium flavum]
MATVTRVAACKTGAITSRSAATVRPSHPRMSSSPEWISGKRLPSGILAINTAISEMGILVYESMAAVAAATVRTISQWRKRDDSITQTNFSPNYSVGNAAKDSKTASRAGVLHVD